MGFRGIELKLEPLCAPPFRKHAATAVQLQERECLDGGFGSFGGDRRSQLLCAEPVVEWERRWLGEEERKRYPQKFSPPQPSGAAKELMFPPEQSSKYVRTNDVGFVGAQLLFLIYFNMAACSYAETNFINYSNLAIIRCF